MRQEANIYVMFASLHMTTCEVVHNTYSRNKIGPVSISRGSLFVLTEQSDHKSYFSHYFKFYIWKWLWRYSKMQNKNTTLSESFKIK